MDNPELWRRTREDVLIALAQVTETAAELARFMREGPHHTHPFDNDIVCKMAEATKIVAEAEAEYLKPFASCTNEIAENLILAQACARHIEGWAG